MQLAVYLQYIKLTIKDNLITPQTRRWTVKYY